jgi:hypothetical protein
MSLLNCTISGNTDYGGTGGVANYGMLSLNNTIVAGNNGGDLNGTLTGGGGLCTIQVKPERREFVQDPRGSP